MNWLAVPHSGRDGCDVPQSRPAVRRSHGVLPERSCCSELPRLDEWLPSHPPMPLLLPSLLHHKGTRRKYRSLRVKPASFTYLEYFVFVIAGEWSRFGDCQCNHALPTPEQLPRCWHHGRLCPELVQFNRIRLFLWIPQGRVSNVLSPLPQMRRQQMGRTCCGLSLSFFLL